MSKRKGWKAEQRRHQVSGQGTQISAKILEKVSVIRESAWRRAGEDSSSSEEGEEKEEKRHGSAHKLMKIMIAALFHLIFGHHRCGVTYTGQLPSATGGRGGARGEPACTQPTPPHCQLVMPHLPLKCSSH